MLSIRPPDADDVAFAVVLDVAGAAADVVPLERLDDVAEGQAKPTSFAGSGCTWYCFTYPPIASTPATPVTVRSCGRMIQSWTVRR